MSGVVEFNLETRRIEEHTLESADLSVEGTDRIWWIDLDRSEVGAVDGLAESLAIDPEELALLVSAEPPCGLVEREDSVTVTLEAWTGALGVGRPGRITIHLTERYCLTITAGPVRSLEEFKRTYKRHFKYAQSPGFVLFLILDSLIENLANTIAPVEEDCAALSDRIYSDREASVTGEIAELRRKILALLRVATQRRDVLMRLSARRIPVVTETCRSSFGDVFTQAQALCGSLESLRDTVSGLFDSFMAIQAQHMNETMKVLTVFASVLMPMTLVAGVYGMNFQNMPELSQPLAYPICLGVMAAIGGVTLLWFRRKGWF